MFLRKIFFSTLLVLALPIIVFASGKRDIDEKTVDNSSNWQETFDLSEKKEGRYNILITATDSGGNTSNVGPFNIFIDAESDLPVTGITNPVQANIVVGNLNIVGTSFDDDEIDYVELILDGDRENPIRAEGSEFWSYYLDTNDLDEGIHSIEAYSVDINGLRGDSVFTNWTLNRQQPLTSVENYSLGQLVSGKISLEGTVVDGNGIESLLYSLDRGETFHSIKLKHNKKENFSTFSLTIDTKKLEDGPSIAWLKSEDLAGSVNVYTWLFFVDNTEPTVEILYPSDTYPVNGIFSVSGIAQDTIGIQSLTWKLGKDLTGEIPLIPGNPYWVADFDLRNYKGDDAKLIVTATDIAGNVTELDKEILIDSAADIPTINVQFPPENYSITDELYIRGIVNDDDSVAKIYYSINEKEEVSLDTDGVFYATIPIAENAFEIGENTIHIRAEDIHGITSPVTDIPVLFNNTPFVISNPKIVPTKKTPEVDYFYGMTIATAIDTKFNYSVTGTDIIETTWKLGNSSPQIIDSSKSPKDSVSVSIPLADAPLGFVPLEISSRDLLGRTISEKFALYIERQPVELPKLKEGEAPPPEPILKIDPTNKFIWLPESSITELSKNVYSMSPNTAYNGFADFKLPIKVSISSETSDVSNVTASVSGNVVSVTSSKEGIYNDILVTITDFLGKEYTAEKISFTVSNGAPTLTLDSSIPYKWVQKEVDLFGTVSDIIGIKSLSLSLDNGVNWKDIEILEDNKWRTTLNLTSFSDGLIPIDIRAINTSNQEKIVRTAIRKDTTAPTITVIAPPIGSVINGETTLVFEVLDEGGKLVQAQTFIDTVLISDTNETFITPETEDIAINPLIRDIVGKENKPLKTDMTYQFIDAAGNIGKINSYKFSIDDKSDLPIVEVSVPIEGTLIQTDFEVSGIAYDDDGSSDIYAKIDTGDFFLVADKTNTFSFPVSFEDLTDNEHSITAYAVDLHGVKGEEKKVTFNVSREEPKGEVLSPAIGETISGLVTLNGVTSDKNGIANVFISLDNGNTYNEAEGTDQWQYVFDTRIFEDGTHVVFLKVIDKFGVEAIYSSLLNIDNTAPYLSLDLPVDGSSTAKNLFLSGQSTDDIGLDKLSVRITSLDSVTNTVPEELQYIELSNDIIIAEVIDLSFLKDGFYNIQVTGQDAAGNKQRVSRNIEKDSAYQDTKVDLMYPLTGEHVSGIFNIYGQAISRDPISKLILFVDNKYISETTLSDTGYFKFTVTPDLVTEGSHSMYVQSITQSGEQIDSNKHILNYIPYGPWIVIDNFTMGDFATNRPWLEGSAGYAISESDLVILESKESTKEQKEAIKNKEIEKIEISFNNGKTFQEIGTKEKWRFRIENDYLEEGYHFLMLRATMKNGEKATTRSIIRIDKTSPDIHLISPGEGNSFNDNLEVIGLASDDIELNNVTIAVRQGDKGSYEVPSFIQGLYFDVHFLGNTLFDIGVGLSFFDDNVKLQFQYGQLTQSQFQQLNGTNEGFRYGGHVYGGKLLANVATIPFSSFAGPDWRWLSASVALGANFSYFSESQSGKGQMLSSILLQLEFPRITIPEQDVFSTFSFYTEGQLWFIPTDVKNTTIKIQSVVPRISIGLRANVF